MKNILAFGASSSKQSINQQLAQYAAQLIPNAKVELLDLNNYEMPIFSVDKELANGIPELALTFAKKIDESDLIIISFAEHNGAYSAAFKNIFDWISRIPGRKAFGDKDMILLATSTGARGGQGVLDIAKNRMPFNGGKVLATFSLPSFNENFKEGAISNETLRQELHHITAHIA